MTINEACQRARDLNRTEEAKGTATRYVVVSDPIGTPDCKYQVISRRVRLRRGRS
jgi:hypothetical protein